MPDEKYVVIKKDQFDFMLKVAGIGVDETIIVKDAVVIRTQDAFAAAGLSAYAHLIDFQYFEARDLFREEEMRQLEPVRDYFHAVAQEAEDRLARGECKLPD